MIQKANKEENKVWKLLAPIVVLTCIGLVITAALAVTNQLTAPVIAAQQAAAADAALKVVLPDGSDFTDITGVELPEGVTAAKVAGNGAGYVFTTTGKGFGGDISVMVGLDANGAITGTKVLSNSETQGIGSKVVEDGSAFQQQLPGMTDTSGIQATSGATVSSNGMISAIQAAFDAYVVSTGGTVEATVYEAPANLTDDVLAEYYPGAPSPTWSAARCPTRALLCTPLRTAWAALWMWPCSSTPTTASSAPSPTPPPRRPTTASLWARAISWTASSA